MRAEDDLSRLLEIAFDIVRSAAEILNSNSEIVARTKSDRDLVTQSDLAIEQHVADRLECETPTLGFLGEETGRSDEKECYWVLDPIDGTSNFAHGIPLHGISLGLVVDEEPALGVISLPRLGQTFGAYRGGGATLNGMPIQRVHRDELSGSIVSIGDFATGHDAPQRNAPRFRVAAALAERVERVRMLGSAATDLAWVAAGYLDAVVIHSNNPWDVVAGVSIAREAGVSVTDLDGSPHTLQSSGLVASSGALTSQLVRVLQNSRRNDELLP